MIGKPIQPLFPEAADVTVRRKVMKATQWILGTWILVLVAGCGEPPKAPAKPPSGPPPLLIDFDNAGLETIWIKNDNLIFTWHEHRPGDDFSAESYERREFRTRLNEKQVQRVWDWVRTYSVLEFEEPDAGSLAPRRRSTGFKTRLKVVTADKRIDLSWTPDDSWPIKDPREAVKALLRLCREFCAEKEGKS